MNLRRTAVSALCLAAVAALPMVSAGAGAASIEVFATPSFDRDVASFDLEFEVVGGTECDSPITGAAFAEGTEDEVAATFTLGQGTGSVVFGDDVPGGYYDVVLSCFVGEEVTISGSAGAAYARGLVDKVVTGTAPAGTEFVIVVDCEGEDEREGAGLTPDVVVAEAFDLTFTYGATGGREGFVVYEGQGCTVTETEDGGALSSTVSGDFEFPEPENVIVTVTNAFAGPAAQPVVVAPQFTG